MSAPVWRPVVLRRARLLTSLAASGTVLEDGGLVLEDGKVALRGTTAEADAWVRAHEGLAPEVVDVAGNVVLPGLVNAHTHLYSTLARGMPLIPGRPAPPDFQAILEEIWWPLDRALDEEDVRLSALVGLAECIRAGVTTTVDHHASERAIEGSCEAVARAAQDLGVRVATCFETTDRDGPEIARRGIEENVRFARWARTQAPLGGAPQVAGIFGLHASLTLTDATLERCRGAAKDAGLEGFHIHVAESRFDPEDSLAKSRVRTVERLAKAGILGSRSIAAHCVHVDSRERGLLAESGTLVVTNPSSNRNNAVGRADLAAHLAARVRVAAGSDGMTPDVLGEVAQLFLLGKDAAAGGPDPRAGWSEASAALEGTTRVARALFGEGSGLGELRPGGPADVAILDYDPWTPFETANWLGHVLYGNLGARVRDVLCGGRWVLRDGRFPGTLDLERATARARERARALWDRRAQHLRRTP